MGRGELVSDHVVIAMVTERAGCLRCRGGFLLDGFPRTWAQAEALDAMLSAQGVILDAVVSYDLPLEEIVERLGGRRTCAGCNAVYHVITRKPRVESICDQCGGHLVLREDDHPESIRVRMRAYAESTRPLTDYYERSGRLLMISAAGSPAEILEHSLHALDERLATGRARTSARFCGSVSVPQASPPPGAF
jgi:adenylate kinase